MMDMGEDKVVSASNNRPLENIAEKSKDHKDETLVAPAAMATKAAVLVSPESKKKCEEASVNDVTKGTPTATRTESSLMQRLMLSRSKH